MKNNSLTWEKATTEQKKDLVRLYDACEIAIKETKEYFKQKHKAKKGEK